MNGRTYRIPSTENYQIYNRGVIGDKYFSSEYYTDYTVWTEITIPDGTWVAELPHYGGPRLIGIDRDRVRVQCIDERRMMGRWLYLADQPFGFIAYAGSYWNHYGSVVDPLVGPMRLSYAQQIHKGELGQGVPIPKLKFAREHSGIVHKMYEFDRNRDQKRNHLRWARFSDVVEASGLYASELLRQYWPFVGRENQIDVRFGASHDAVSAQLNAPSYLTLEEIIRQIADGLMEETWIRSGPANTLLRLVALNYQPTAASTA